MRKVITAFALLMSVAAGSAAAQTYPQETNWRFSSPRGDLPRVSRGRQDNPQCANDAGLRKASDVLAQYGAAYLDSVARQNSATFDEGFLFSDGEDAIKNEEGGRDLFQIPTHLASCVTEVLLVPKDRAAGLSIFGCLSNKDGSGLACGTSGWKDRTSMGVFNLTAAETEKTTIYALTGKNWSHQSDRWFWIVASGVDPVTGGPLALSH